jgi:hypothetical protein
MREFADWLIQLLKGLLGPAPTPVPVPVKSKER